MAFDDTCAAAGMVPEGSCPLAASLVNRSVAFPLNQRIGKTAAQKIAKVLATLP
jgi:dTDP-4-amino-4,6-dideoxygalactose transaminase